MTLVAKKFLCYEIPKLHRLTPPDMQLDLVGLTHLLVHYQQVQKNLLNKQGTRAIFIFPRLYTVIVD